MGTERYDYVIAGCGLAGAIIAREMDEKGKNFNMRTVFPYRWEYL